MNYVPLDTATPTLFSQPLSFTIGQTGGLLSVSILVMTIMLIAIGTVGAGRILYALGLRVANFGEASEANYTKSKKIISTVLFTLVFSFGLVLFALAINPDLVKGTVGWEGLRVGGGAGAIGSQMATQQSSGGLTSTSASCPSTDTYKSSLVAGGNVCAGATCQALSGCNLSPYNSIIEQESARQGVDPSLVKAIMCRESKGAVNAVHVNNPATNVDCGLMQINKPGTTCDASDLEPSSNISKGVALIKQKFASVTLSYPGITKEMMVLASYNCCGTEGSPNQASVDCTPTSGFPFTLPKWACPINPGPTATNMCFVRGYVCDVNACLNQLNQ